MRKLASEKLRQANHQLELVTIALDELIAMVEADLRRQRRYCLESRKSHLTKS